MANGSGGSEYSKVSKWTSGLGFAYLVVQGLSAVLSPRCACDVANRILWTRHLPRRRVGRASGLRSFFFLFENALFAVKLLFYLTIDSCQVGRIAVSRS